MSRLGHVHGIRTEGRREESRQAPQSDGFIGLGVKGAVKALWYIIHDRVSYTYARTHNT